MIPGIMTTTGIVAATTAGTGIPGTTIPGITEVGTALRTTIMVIMDTMDTITTDGMETTGTEAALTVIGGTPGPEEPVPGTATSAPGAAPPAAHPGV